MMLQFFMTVTIIRLGRSFEK